MFEQFYTPVTFGLSSQIVPIAEGNETAYTRQVNTFLNAYLPSPNLPVFAFLRWLADDVRFNDDLTKVGMNDVVFVVAILEELLSIGSSVL